jgi:hypothetical protein
VRPSADNLKRELRALAKEAIWFATTWHEPGPKRDICLFCTRRGGSTMVMEAIAANRGVKFIDQPLEVTTETLTTAQSRRMPKVNEGELVTLDEDEAARVRNLLDDIFAGRLPVNAPWRFWRRGFSLRTNRLVLKIVGAKALIDWFDQSYDVDIVYLTRHPIPQALSCIRNGWSLTAKAYLRDPSFVEEHLDAGTHAWCWDTLRSGSPLDRFVLNWALENVVPLRVLPDRPAWSYLSYEATVLEPTVLLALADALGLTDRDAVLSTIGRPSRSSGLSSSTTRDLISRGDRAALLGRWRRDVTPDEERTAMAALDRLGIDLYRPGEDVPAPLHRISPPRY